MVVPKADTPPNNKTDMSNKIVLKVLVPANVAGIDNL